MHVFRRFISLFIISVLLLTSVNAEQLALPKSDITAPEIIHEPLTKSIKAGSGLQLKVIARDANGIKNVVIFYRKPNADDFFTRNMRSAGNDVFIAEFSAQELSSPGLEYYVRAEDFFGNSLLHGYSFSPLLVQIDNESNTPVPVSVLSSSSERSVNKPPNTTPWYKNKWVWIGAGVLTAATATAVIVSREGDTEPSTTIQFSLPPLQ